MQKSGLEQIWISYDFIERHIRLEGLNERSSLLVESVANLWVGGGSWIIKGI